jgi:putative AlgH/UPF0301 family transcriptional regulator
MAEHNVPMHRRFVFGQSVWVEGQLEREIKTNRSWLTLPTNHAIIWDESPDQWKHAIEICASTTMDQYI